MNLSKGKLIKFAMVTAHQHCGGPIRERIKGDFWDMYGWLHLFDGYHYSFESLRDNPRELNDYDAVLMVGNSGYIEDIITFANATKAVTIFFPDGDDSLYLDQGVHPVICQAWQCCSAVGCAREDMVPFYSALCGKPVGFLHIPVPDNLCKGEFFTRYHIKTNDMLVYGDNNPNNPLVALAVARRLRVPVLTTALSLESVEFAKRQLGIEITRAHGKICQFDYLTRFVALSKVMVYPTRWIGTSRQFISGALCGTPVVGNRDSHTAQRLFPSLTTHIYDIDKMCELVKRLYEDTEFYREVCEYALEQVKYYSATNAKKRFLELYERAKSQ